MVGWGSGGWIFLVSVKCSVRYWKERGCRALRFLIIRERYWKNNGKKRAC